MSNIPETFGALLLGGFLAMAFSGVVSSQFGLYFKTYRTDSQRLRTLVVGIWILDLFHSGLVCATLWIYLITWFEQDDKVDVIPWTVPITILLTAILTFLVHCFFAHRILRLSNGRWSIAGAIALLAFLRLCAACTTTGEMLRLKSFSLFTHHFSWVFTLGLAISSGADILITAFLCYLFRQNRSGSTSNNINEVLDTLMLYAFENGSLTCAGSIAAMICWLIMPHNRIFLGLHFVISKLYANSLLTTLNARKRLREGRPHSTSGEEVVSLPVMFHRSIQAHGSGANPTSHMLDGFVVPSKSAGIGVEKALKSRHDKDNLLAVSVDKGVQSIVS